VPARS